MTVKIDRIDVSLAASLALFGTFGLDKPAALNAPQFLSTSVLAKPLAIRQDMAQVPDGPGLGVTVDEAKIAGMMNRAGASREGSA